MLAGCSDDPPAPKEVDIVLESSPGALGSADVSAAWISIETVEIVPCDDAGAFRWRDLFTIREAHAHQATTKTLLGVPVLDDLIGAARTVKLGTLEPPRVDFCKVRVTFGPADVDAIGMPANKAPVGRALWITGTEAATPPSFKLTTTTERVAELQVPRFRPGERGTRTSVHLSRTRGDALAGVDLSSSAIAESSNTVLGRLIDATHVEVR